MDTNDQLASLRTRIGEPVDPDQCRFTPAQLLDFLNASRREIAEDTRCYPVKDKITFTAAGTAYASGTAPLPTSGDPFLISLTNDFIWFEQAEYDGLPLRVVRPQDWNDIVGEDDTLAGDPAVVMLHGRKLQIYPVPEAAGAVFRYRGWAYPPELVIGGVDAAFVKRVAEVCIWHAAMVVKGADERLNTFESNMAGKGVIALKAQYMPRGPRYVRTGDVPPSRRIL